jgi:hypothetical protein
MILEFLVAVALGQEEDSSAVARDLEKIERQLAATRESGECTAWSSMLAPEWSVIHIDGGVMTRDEAVEMCNEPRPTKQDFTVDELSVRAFGDTAVVRGRTTVVTGGGDPTTVTLRFTDVFVRRAGRWQVVASHATRLGS